MKNPTLILTEQHPPNAPLDTSPLIQQAVTAWLTKELTKYSLRCVFAAQGFQIIPCRITALSAKMEVSSYAF